MNRDSYVVQKGRCPRCEKQGKDRSGDNFAIYSDGHGYCFSCGFYKTGNSYKNILAPEYKVLHRINEKGEDNRNTKQRYVQNIPIHYKLWLRKYQVTPQIIEFLGVKYNESTDGLYFEVPGGGVVERYNKTDNSESSNPYKIFRVQTWHRPKWKTIKKRTNYFTDSGWRAESGIRKLIIVEDVVSMGRVLFSSFQRPSLPSLGRNHESYALLGSNINDKDLYSLSSAFKSVRVWLDSDKLPQALKIASRASQWNRDVGTIFTVHDPKCYSDEEILYYINK